MLDEESLFEGEHIYQSLDEALEDHDNRIARYFRFEFPASLATVFFMIFVFLCHNVKICYKNGAQKSDIQNISESISRMPMESP